MGIPFISANLISFIWKNSLIGKTVVFKITNIGSNPIFSVKARLAELVDALDLKFNP